jgi:hypothetical protein
LHLRFARIGTARQLQTVQLFCSIRSRVLSKLGAGGMGDVSVAEDTRLDRKVAIKVFPAEFTCNAEKREPIRELALSYLEQSYAADSQWLGWLKGDRIFDPLRSDPRSVALMKKLHFEK